MISSEARNQLVEENLHLVGMVARRFAGKGVEYDDLYQVAALALVRAIDRYDPETGNQISTFVLPCIVGEVKNYFRDRSRMIRMPRRSGELLRAVDKAKQELQQQLGRSPTAAELAEAIGESEERLLEALATQSALSGTMSMDETVDDDEELSLSSMLGSVDPGYGLLENRDLVVDLLSRLPDMEKKVIRERFFAQKSQRETAAALGVSQMTVSRSERKAMEMLKKFLKDEPIQ